MTEYELADLIASTASNMWSGMGMLFTFATAYLVAVYLAGAKLTRGQLTVVNVGFVLGWTLSSFTISETLRNLNRLIALQEHIQQPIPYAMLIFYVLQTLLLIGPLYFMWSIRTNKKDERH